MTTAITEQDGGPGAIRRCLATVAAWVVFLALCVVYAWNTLENHSDFWAHAAIGRWIVEHRQPPTRTLFLWTCHDPWIAHSWLSEAMIYVTVGRLSDTGAAVAGMLSAAGIAFLAFAMLWRLYRVSGRTICPAITLFSIGICAASGRFLPRPEMASFLFLAILLAVLVGRHRTPLPQPLSPPGKGEREDLIPHPNPLLGKERESEEDTMRADLPMAALLIVLFALWTNLHGGMLAGLIVLWIATLADIVQERAGRRSVRFAGIAALCTLATLVNPYGLRYYSIYKAVSTVTFTHILEWEPVYAQPYIPASTLYSLIALLATALFTWVKYPLSVDASGRRRWSYLLWLIAFTAMTVQARRNQGSLALVCIAVAAPYFQAWSARLDSAAARPSELAPRGRKRQPRVEAKKEGDAMRGFWPWVAAIVSLSILANGWQGMGTWPVRAVSPTIANGICAFVNQNGVAGRIFNDYDYGSYLEWRLGPRTPGLYVDGLNAYPDRIFSDYMDILNATPHGTQLLDEQHVDVVVGSANRAAAICRYVAASPEWALAYFGHDGPIWVRRLPQYRSLWDGVPIWDGATVNTYVRYLHTAAHDETD